MHLRCCLGGVLLEGSDFFLRPPSGVDVEYLVILVYCTGR